ncbi:MAG: ROK family protein [Planctomycetota bacterium]
MDLKDLARANRNQILRLVLKRGGISRSQISQVTGLTRASVTTITEKLIGREILHVREIVRNGKRGRPTEVLALRSDRSMVVVAEYTEEAAKAHLVDPAGRIRKTVSRALSAGSTTEEYLSKQLEMVPTLGDGIWDRVQAITVVAPGIVDTARGEFFAITQLGPNTTQMVEPFRRFGKTVVLQNDSRLRALAENWYGTAQDIDDFLYFNVGRGVGGAIVLGGVLVEGPSHGAGEFGHVVVDPDGPPCACGARGCLEAIASAPAVLRSLAGRGCRNLADAWALKEKGDRQAAAAFEGAARVLARSVVNAAIAIGPTTVVVGGPAVDDTVGGIVEMVRGELAGLRSFIGGLDVRRSAIPEERSHVLGALAYALQELDIEA